MKSWPAAFLRARLIAFVVSLAVVLIVEALQLGALLVWLLGSWAIALVLTKTMWWGRLLGIRRAAGDEVDLLRAAAGQVPELRGRHEPTLWVGRGAWIRLHNPRILIVGADWVDYLSQGGAPEQVADHLAVAVARAEVDSKTWVMTVEILTAPGRVLLLPITQGVARRPALRWWMQSWLTILSAIATVQLTHAGRWPAAIGLWVLVAASIVGPRWAAQWRQAYRAVGSSHAVTPTRSNQP